MICWEPFQPLLRLHQRPYTRSQDKGINRSTDDSGQKWLTLRCQQPISEENTEHSDEPLHAANIPDATISLYRFRWNAAGNLSPSEIFSYPLLGPDDSVKHNKHRDPPGQNCQGKSSRRQIVFDEHPNQHQQHTCPTARNRKEPFSEGGLIHGQAILNRVVGE